jgi:predicted nucleic acid-binding protein
MTGGYPQPVVLDTTVVSNFASTDSISFFATVLESPVVVPAVREELERGLDAGHGYLDTAVDALDDELPVRPVSADDGVQDIRDRLDRGEAESLLGAIEHSGTLATDDLAARKIADQRGVPVTGSIGLLVLGVEAAHLDCDTADEWLDTWREQRGYYAPVDSVAEILGDEG